MLKSIYIAPDEFIAITIKEMLAGNNIKAIARRFETSWLDGLPKIMKGGWGDIMVDEKDAQLAEEYIKEFLQEHEEINPDTEANNNDDT